MRKKIKMAKSKMQQEAELTVEKKKLDVESKKVGVKSEEQQIIRRNIEVCNSIVMHANSKTDGIFCDLKLLEAKKSLAKKL